MFQAPPVGVPSAMLGHDDPYWHTDLDTIEKVDPTRLKHVGTLGTVLSLLPTWGADESEALAEWLLTFSHRELTLASKLARSADGAMKRLLLDTALTIETSRAGSLAKFLGMAGWDSTQHLDALQAAYHALARNLERAEVSDEATPDAGKPMRILDGPVRYSIMQELSKDDREFLEDKLFSHHGAPPQVLVNLADGTRTIAEIAAHMSLDFQRVFDVDDIARTVELLMQVGYLETVQ